MEPTPLGVAARLVGRSGFAFLHAASSRQGGGPSFVAVDPIASSSAWLPPDCVAFPGEDLETRAPAPRWIGVLPYEAARGLERPRWTRAPDERPLGHFDRPIWRRYAAVVEIDPMLGIVRVIGDDPRRVDALARVLEAAPVAIIGGGVRLEAVDDEPAGAHVARIERARALIRAGDLYQVNLARRLRFATRGKPFDLYRALARQAPAPFGACFDWEEGSVCASSPELFLATGPRGRVWTSPIKGTRPRGTDVVEDRRLARELDENAKEIAELTMILDVERNDLGRIASSGSVRILRSAEVETYPTVHHRFATVGARVDPRYTQLDVLRATLPSGSVTGAPKVRAMEVIAELEPVRRGLYTGAFGSVAYDGSLTLAMAIRLLTIRKQEAHYFAGGGIVADSDPQAELEETRWKAAQLEHLRESWPNELS